jgi:hypothetical protein
MKKQECNIKSSNEMYFNFICRGDNPQDIKRGLNNNNIKMSYDNYQEFLGISIAHGRVEVLKILLDHYEKTKLQDDPESIPYKYARSKLLTILQEEYDSCFVNEEIQKILDRFDINENDDEYTDREEDFVDWEDLDAPASNVTSSSYISDSSEMPPLTFESLKELQTELVGNSLEIEV